MSVLKFFNAVKTTNVKPIAAILTASGASFAAGHLYGQNFALKNVTSNPDAARKFLPSILDASKVPHGDMAVGSKTVHSRRHIISQWQRSATGAVVIILGRDQEGKLSIALGPQRGEMVPPQGYMESPLPKEDLTGLRAKNASRINGTTGALVYADNDLEECAVREVKEELGVIISKEQLHVLGVNSGPQANPIVPTVAVTYGVLLNNTPNLKTVDTEFKADDMAEPQWFKLKDLQSKEGKLYVVGSPLPIKQVDIKTIQTAINKLPGVTDNDKKSCSTLLAFNADMAIQIGKSR